MFWNTVLPTEQRNKLPENEISASSINSFTNKVDEYLRVIEEVEWL